MRRLSNTIAGNGNGAMIMSLMGAVWMFVGLYGISTVWLLFALLPAVFFGSWGVKLTREAVRIQATEPPPSEAEITAEKTLGKRFAWVFGGEGVAIFLAVNVLANIGENAFLLPTIGIIVGLHFLPLARLFHYSLYYWTGALQIALCVAAAAAIHSRPHVLNVFTGVGMAVTLWLTVLAVLLQARRLQTSA